MTSAFRSLANTEFWSTPISKSRPVSDLKRVTREGLKVQSSRNNTYHGDTERSGYWGKKRTLGPSSLVREQVLPFRSRRSPDHAITRSSPHPCYPVLIRGNVCLPISAIFGNFSPSGNFLDQCRSVERFAFRFRAISAIPAIPRTTSSRPSASHSSSHSL